MLVKGDEVQIGRFRLMFLNQVQEPRWRGRKPRLWLS